MRLKADYRLLLPFLLATLLPLQAQQTIASNAVTMALPDAPQPIPAEQPTPSAKFQAQNQPSSSAALRPAPRLAKYIDPDQQAARLSAKEKLELSGWEQLQPYAFGTQILAAGWEHMLNSDPKYGTDSGAFGERLGAAFIRQNSQAILSDGVFAAAFREDPRYYRKGSGKFMNRLVYAVARVVVTRNDAGDPTPNYAQLVGYAGASALTMTYYPAVSATWSKTAAGYGVSLAGSALGNGVHEFLPDIMHYVFHHNQ